MARPTDPKVKAAALADLALGMGPTEVADKHGIPEETVKSWRKRGLVPRPVAPPREVFAGDVISEDAPLDAPALHPTAPPLHPLKKDIGELLYDYVGESLETLRSIIVFARDPAWLKKQSAAELATFFGVTNDKVARLLAALQQASSESGPNGPGS